MCGRYLFYDAYNPNPNIQFLIESAKRSLPLEQFQQLSTTTIYPSNKVLTGIYSNNTFHSVIMQWGWNLKNKSLINARIESIFSSNFYVNAKPCALLCSGYYEWDQAKKKYFFSCDTEMYLAGLYKLDDNVLSFVIITEPATNQQASIHHRQPIVLSKDNAMIWCKTKTSDIQTLSIHSRNITPTN